MNDRQKLHGAFAVLDEAGIRGDGAVACGQTCGLHEVEQRGFDRFVFWHDQCESAFGEDDDLVGTLHLYHSGGEAPERAAEALEAYGFDVEWDGSDGRALRIRRRTALPDERKGMHLSIKLNNAATNDPCAICGQRTDPETGPELFLGDTWGLVCWRCGDEHAPDLVQCLLEYRWPSRRREEGIFARRANQRDPEEFAATQEDWEE